MYDIIASERSGVEVRVRVILRAVGNSVDKFVCCCCFFVFFCEEKNNKTNKYKSPSRRRGTQTTPSRLGAGGGHR